MKHIEKQDKVEGSLRLNKSVLSAYNLYENMVLKNDKTFKNLKNFQETRKVYLK